MDSHQLDTSEADSAFTPGAAPISARLSRSAPSGKELLRQLRERLGQLIGELPLGGAEAPDAALVSVTLKLPFVPGTIPQTRAPQFQFSRAAESELRAGFGIAAEWQTNGPDRLRTLAGITRQWDDQWQRLDPDQTGFRPFAMLGFAAAPEPTQHREDQLPNTLLWIPEIALRRGGDRAALVFTARQSASPSDVLARWNSLLDELAPGLDSHAANALPAGGVESVFSNPERALWDQLIDRALEDISARRIEKVVLSRRLDVRGERRFDISRLLGVLGRAFPSCEVIHLRRNQSHFVAATPERLLHLRQDNLVVDAIAGTAERAEGVDADLALGQSLLNSAKNLHEHQLVVDAVTEALSSCCESTQQPTGPELMQLSNAQHLWSPIRARIKPGTDIFELAERLHPTPATNGQPRFAAHQWLRQHEPFARGWYTGAAGFLEPGWGGELWVLLRCARIDGDQAELFAGAGIVGGSDAEAEWQETEAKLAAMLSALRFA